MYACAPLITLTLFGLVKSPLQAFQAGIIQSQYADNTLPRQGSNQATGFAQLSSQLGQPLGFIAGTPARLIALQPNAPSKSRNRALGTYLHPNCAQVSSQ